MSCPGREVSSTAINMGISLHNFTVEAQILLVIIFSGISPYTIMTYVPDMTAFRIACILNNTPLKVRGFIILDIKHSKLKESSLLLLLSLITEFKEKLGLRYTLEIIGYIKRPHATLL